MKKVWIATIALGPALFLFGNVVQSLIQGNSIQMEDLFLGFMLCLGLSFVGALFSWLVFIPLIFISMLMDKTRMYNRVRQIILLIAGTTGIFVICYAVLEEMFSDGMLLIVPVCYSIAFVCSIFYFRIVQRKINIPVTEDFNKEG